MKILNNFHQFLELAGCIFARRGSIPQCKTNSVHSSYRRAHKAKKQNCIPHTHSYGNQKYTLCIHTLSYTPYKMEPIMKATVKHIYFS